MRTYNKAQRDRANEVLRGYALNGTTFSDEDYQQKGQWIFTAHTNAGDYFVIVGIRGAVIDSGWTSV